MSSRIKASKRSSLRNSAVSRRSRLAASSRCTSWKAGVKSTVRSCRTNSCPSPASRCVLPVPGLPKTITLTAWSMKLPSRSVANVVRTLAGNRPRS